MFTIWTVLPVSFVTRGKDSVCVCVCTVPCFSVSVCSLWCVRRSVLVGVVCLGVWVCVCVSLLVSLYHSLYLSSLCLFAYLSLFPSVSLLSFPLFLSISLSLSLSLRSAER